MNNPNNTTNPPNPLPWPQAQTRSKPSLFRYLLWFIPVTALITALVLTYQSTRRQGIPLQITFQNGHGLKAGDSLRYRGIEVGIVDRVALTPDLEHIQVSLQLNPEAAALAKAGSHFWIVHPQLDFSGAAGLETVLGSKYIAVLPGQGEPQQQFTGLDNAPLLEDMPAGGLEIVLQSLHKGSLQVGAQINFRGLPVGRIIAVTLASDASAVDARVYIEPAYVRLLNPATQFWQEDGLELQGGLTSGFTIRLKSLQSLLTGQIQFATPQHSTTPLAPGHRFVLYDHPQPEWLTWKPTLPVNTQQAALVQPKPIAARLRWQQQEWWLNRQKQRTGWIIPVKNGWVASAALLEIPAESSHVELQLGDQILPNPLDWQVLTPEIRYRATTQTAPAWELPPQTPDITMDTQIVADPAIAPKFISAARYSVQSANQWLIDRNISLPDDWQGAAVVNMAGQLIGLLQLDKKSPAQVILLPIPLVKTQ